MEATQLIDDSILEESEEEDDGEKRGEPLAKLRVLKNKHITETELPLYQGENVLGRNPDSCSLPLVARSVSKQHTIISISMFCEALVWDLGSMNGTRKGRTKLTPHVRYALTEGDDSGRQERGSRREGNWEKDKRKRGCVSGEPGQSS
uniref:FHA domain-containing protein n=1 Tax=Hucho hucho TaxID=62062 RepID=A0A4W5QGB5_9TELE